MTATATYVLVVPPALGVSSKQRSTIYPDIPTIAEQVSVIAQLAKKAGIEPQ